jgi:hypothetical protein
LPPSILTANSELTKNFKDLDTLSNNMLEQTTDSEKKQMKKLQDEILIFLKNPKILKSITDQL